MGYEVVLLRGGDGMGEGRGGGYLYGVGDCEG